MLPGTDLVAIPFSYLVVFLGGYALRSYISYIRRRRYLSKSGW
jgi:hypothetical protein